MVEGIDQIRAVAQRDTSLEQIRIFVDQLIQQDKVKALSVVKQLFFAPETHPQVRFMLAQRLGQIAPHQLFQQLLSYYILRKFPDTLSLIAALRSFKHAEAIPALIDHYPEATYREQLEIIEALAQISAPQTVEFLSRIFNNQINYQQSLSTEQLEEIRQRASSALSRKIMRIEK